VRGIFDLIDDGRYEDAFRVWSAVAPNQRDHVHYNNGGTLHLLLRDYEGAVRCYEKSRAIGPTVRSSNTDEGVALALWLGGNKADAINRQQKLIDALDRSDIEYSSDPWGIGPRLRMAAFYVLDGNADLASKAVDAAVKVAIDSPYKKAPHAMAMLLGGQLDEVDLFAEARRGGDGAPRSEKAANRTLCTAEFYAGVSCLIRGHAEKARKYFKKAAKRHAILEDEWFLAREIVQTRVGVSHG
jgi:tetratricopeptide (TPR) repeat protein